MAQDLKELAAIVAEVVAQRNAQISQSISGREALIKVVPLDFTTARSRNDALKISIPFKSVYVENASDSTTAAYLSLGDNTLSSIGDSKLLKANDSFEFSSMIASAYLWWDAQSGKSMNLVFSTTGIFKPGSQISQLSGGVSVSDGSTLTSNLLTGGVAKIACAAGVATQILSADTDRKLMALYIDNPAWIGDASVSPNARGVFYPSGTINISSTAAHYLYPVGGVVNVFGNDYR